MQTFPNLFERIGGRPGVEDLVEAFYVRVLADPLLTPFFKDVPLERLRRMQTEFFSRALGGPVAYSGESLAHVHHGRGITLQHFSLFTGHLLETLRDRGLEDAETGEVIEHLNTLANEITGAPY